MYKLAILCLLILTVQCYFKDNDHKEIGGHILESFFQNFKQRYSVFSLSGLDFMSNMELGLGYWVTKISARDAKNVDFSIQGDSGLIEIRSPEIHIDITIEDKYVVPIKITNFMFQTVISSAPDFLRVLGVKIDYNDISLDLNLVIEYFSRQILSLDMVKKAIKDSEIPLRNLIGNAIRNNRDRLQWLINGLQDKNVNTQVWVDFLGKVPFTVSTADEYILDIKNLFGQKSVRNQDKQDDL